MNRERVTRAYETLFHCFFYVPVYIIFYILGMEWNKSVPDIPYLVWRQWFHLAGWPDGTGFFPGLFESCQTGQTGQNGQGSTKVDVAQVPPNISVNVAAPPAAATPASSGNDILKGILYTLAALAALGGAIALGYAMSGGSSSDQTKAPTTTTSTDQQQQVEKRIIQSPLQFLEDIGAHRPEIVDE